METTSEKGQAAQRKLEERPGGLPASAEPPDYKLLLDTLPKRIMAAESPGELEAILVRKDAWQSLGPEEALRWCRMAQLAGLTRVSLEILAWINRTYPQQEDAWQEHLDLLEILELREERVRVRAQALAVLGPGAVRKPAAAPTGPAPSYAQEAAPEPAPAEETPGEDLDDIGDPFLDMRRQEQRVRRYMDLFRGREDVFARQWHEQESDTSGYVPVRRPMQPEDAADHLKGLRTYGIYLLDGEDRTRLGVIDIDRKQEYRSRQLPREEWDQLRREENYLLERLATLSEQAAMPCVLEFTGGKGYHLWYVFEQSMPAATVRAALRSLVVKVQSDVRMHGIEIFPKQDQVSGKGLGNLVKLPLGIHRGTGKPSYFLLAPDRGLEAQLDFLSQVKRIPAGVPQETADAQDKAKVIVHPRHEAWAREYPELAVLEERCSILAQILSSCRHTRSLGIREEKILLGTLGHLPRARRLLHHVFCDLPEYNRPLLDYKISRIRGTPLGCRRIHSLAGDGAGGTPCRFEGLDAAYHTPLLHLEGGRQITETAKAETAENLEDALENLATCLRQVQRFLKPGPR